MAASRPSSSTWRICRRYKFFFYVCFLVLCIQLFIGYNFYTSNQEELSKIRKWKENIDARINGLAFTPALPQRNVHGIRESNVKPGYRPDIEPAKPGSLHDADIKAAKPYDDTCPPITAGEALSAIARAKTENCRSQLKDVECKNQKRTLYPKSLPNLCHLKGENEKGKYLGCFKDSQKERDLNSVNIDFPKDNSPHKCINFCYTGGYLYAGLQYQKECWCGKTYGAHGSLSESSCHAACPGNKTEFCGGFTAQRVFSTGLADKKKNTAELVEDHESIGNLAPVRIVFVLTVHGRAVRQVMRLLSIIYKPTHYYYIHVDSRSAYMYRELLKLEDLLPNVRLARDRYATIWGGASLLQAHLAFIKSLLAMTDWKWDYYLNLSESDYPVNTVDKLTTFLTKHRGNNFLKSNGRETHTFIKKQGLGYTFYECENHLWRLGKRELPTGIRLDGGSDWIVLYRDFCEYTTHSTDPLVTGLKELYLYSLLPVESFFHTVIHNSQFCEKWVDNNLHLTNWKRKQGCKCQHKNQVDWCGCSPNDFKPMDLDKLTKAKTRTLFFARKFESIVSLDILNSMDTELGKDLSDLPNLNYYWQNDYHHLDPWSTSTDRILSHASSLACRTAKILSSANPDCSLTDVKVIETNLLYIADSFHRYLVLYNVTVPSMSKSVTVESQFSKSYHYRILDPKGSIGRLQNLEVGTDFDPKELIFRNYAGFLGPMSDVGIRHVWGQGLQTTVTSAWIDPAGEIAAYQDINIQPESHIGHHKPKLKTPLRPGVWTVKLLSGLKISAEVKFTVLPYSTYKQDKLTEEDAVDLHGGPVGLYSQQDYSDLSHKLGVENAQELLSQSVINSKKTGLDLEEWIDDLSERMWSMQDTCSTVDLGLQCPPLELCANTRWSSLTPDLKSEITIRRTNS